MWTKLSDEYTQNYKEYVSQIKFRVKLRFGSRIRTSILAEFRFFSARRFD